MADTKFNIEQINRPAPLWYRRFSNAMVALVIPAASEFVSSLELASKTENRVLHGFIFLAAIIKGVGVFLGNGQSYTDKVITIVLFCLFLNGCSSTRRAADRERAYIQQLQRTYAVDTVPPVILTVPGGMIHLTDTTPCPDFHNSEVTSKGGILTVAKPCPGIKLSPDSVARSSALYRAAILARRDAEINAAQEREARLRSEGTLRHSQREARTGWALFFALALGNVVFFFIKGRI